MTARRPTAREKIADWTLAYHVMLEEIAYPDNGYTLDAIQHDRRTAALAAAILVANAGVERAVVTGTFEDSLDG